MATTKGKSSFRETVQASLALKWVGKGKTADWCLRSLTPPQLQALSRLESFTRVLERGHAFGARLPREDLSASLTKVKRFCEGILEPCERHGWKPLLRRRDLRTRVSVASSLFLFRKVVLPPAPTEAEKSSRILEYVRKMTTPQDLPPSDLLSFVSSEIKREFSIGWDRRWDRACDLFTLPTTSCLENSRAKGGARGEGLTSDMRAEYEEFVSGVKTLLPSECTPLIVETGGKFRLVTKFSSRRSFLQPLHRILYDYLSEKEWLLRGEATQDKFNGFEVKEGEVFVSGDYESATDNLNIHLSRYVLGVLRSRSTHVPSNVWDSAFVALRSTFDGVEQQSGQLMGSLLSFPLLCLVNYLTFRYSIRRKVPVRVNGDDIVFRATTEEKDRWFKLVQDSGLVVSKGKTLVSKKVFSLNSTFFLSGPCGAVCVPSVRASCVFGPAEDPSAICGRLDSCYKGNGVLKDLVQSMSLREMGVQVRSCQRSVRRALGAVCSNRALRWSGLLDRESFYNSLPFEKPVPLTRKEWTQNCVPAGFERVRCEGEDDPMFMYYMNQLCWTSEPRSHSREKWDEYWARVREGTFSYVPSFTQRARRLLQVSQAEFQKLKHFVRAKRTEGKLCWRRKREGEAPLTFLSAGTVRLA